MKHSFKRLFSAVIALALVLGLLPAQALALPTVPGPNIAPFQTETDTYINPLYAGLLTEADLVKADDRAAAGHSAVAPASIAEEDYPASFEEAAVSVREGMVNRQETIVAYYKSMEYVKKDHEKVYSAAIAHTGVPTEGDSLRWVFGGYSVSISRYMGDDGMWYITYTYTMTYYTTAEQEAELTAAVDTLLAELNVEGQSDYRKLCAVYDYMCETIVYDDVNPSDYMLKHTAYAAMIDKTAVCQGYAVLLYRLLLEMGIDNRLVSGIGNGGAHGWNIVKLGDVYYNVDSTWDATWHQAGYAYNYFLRTDDTFEDHTRDEEFLTGDFYAAYPMATADYTPPTIVATGTCGDDLVWTLDTEGLLVIEGTGDMWSFSREAPTWSSYLSSIKTVVLGEGVTSIGNSAFWDYTSLTSVTIPEGVTTIGGHAFVGCSSLTELVLPESVTTINGWAFCNCTSLTSVNIPEAVTFIGMHAFAGCSSLTEAHIPEGVTAIQEHTFDACSALTDVTIPEGVTSIGKYAFAGCTNLTSVTIPEGVTSIDYYAFDGCSSLTEVTIPEGVTSISEGLFRGCTNLANVSLPDSLSTIGVSAFRNCNSLTDLTIPEGVISIGGSAFYYCKSLTSITIPEGVTSIGGWAFYYCSSLTSITIPEGVTSIGDRTFYNCTSLTSITMPDGITSIGEYAFQSCVELPSITIPEGVTTIGEWAFAYCSKLTKVYFTGDAPTIGQSAYTNSAISTCYYPVTNSTWTSDVMQNYGRNADWVPYGHFDIDFASMTMGNSLAINFAFPKDSMDDWTGCYAQIRKTYADDREDMVVSVPFDQWKSTGIGGVAHYYVTFNGIAAKEMTDTVYVTIHKADGTAVSTTKTDSVRDQSMRALAKEDVTDEEKTMIVDMLNYGAAAQDYFGYGAEDLANSQLSEEQKAYASESVPCSNNRVGTGNFAASTVVLKSNIQMMFAFKNIDESHYAVVTFSNHRGAAKEITIQGSEFTANGSARVVTVDALVVADGRQEVTCVVYDAEGNEVASVVDSLESYTARNNGADELFTMMMRYSDSAYNFFHS